MEETIVNKVAASALETIDLEEFYSPGERVLIDLKHNLENGFLLREKSFREFVKEHDWTQYTGKYVAVYCSEDVIIPKWAYMLVATRLAGIAQRVYFGNLESLERELFRENILKIDPENYRDKKVVIKGCGKIEIPESAFLEVSFLLAPYVISLMYGEPCSTVPVLKKSAWQKK